MSLIELREKQEKDIINHWFENHEARYITYTVEGGINTEKIEKLIWSRPKVSKLSSSVYRVNYICDGQFLYVSGDIDEAVFAWSQKVNLEWISKLDLYYFSAKCMASENGKGYECWEEDVAKINLINYFVEDFMSENDTKENYEKYIKNKIISKKAQYFTDKKIKEIESYGVYGRPWESEFNWNIFLHEAGMKILGDGFSEFSKIGNTVDMRCQAYLIGLKMALKYLKEIKILK